MAVKDFLAATKSDVLISINGVKQFMIYNESASSYADFLSEDFANREIESIKHTTENYIKVTVVAS